MKSVDCEHRPRGHCVVRLCTVIVGDMDLFLRLFDVLHDEGVGDYRINHAAEGVKGMLSWVEFGRHGVVDTSG